MKKLMSVLLWSALLLLIGVAVFVIRKTRNHKTVAGMEKEKGLSRTEFAFYNSAYEFMKTRNPQTGKIPENIKTKQLAFAKNLPKKEESRRNQDWTQRGPFNVGGRMLCVAVDITDETHLLAGSASGGMWQSLNSGQTWTKVTNAIGEQSATCIVQDKRPGKTNIWYYGTGELLSTTDRNVSTNVRTVGIGDGIFKSTDNGATWQPLPFTQGGSPAFLSGIFQGIWRIVPDPVNLDQDIVYAACYGAIMRSANGGESWEMVLGDLENKSFGTDLAITSDGVLYAILGSYGWGIEPPEKAGVWRSTDGFQWEEITPQGFPDDNRTSRLALASSNENVLYVFTESQSPNLNPFNGYTNSLNTLWKMTWNPATDAPVWNDRTPGTPGGGSGDINNFPYSLVVYGGYCMTLAVKPDNENVVLIGGMNLYRSENGFADSSQTFYMGGYPYDMDSINMLHPDMHGTAFLPSNPNVLFIACDGGVQITENCMAASEEMYWSRLNSNLVTSQFYSVSIDQGSSGDDWILGGLQDNNWYYTITDDPSELWMSIDICYDGFATCVAPDWEYSVISAYSGNIWTTQFDETMHTKNIFPQLPDTLLAFYDPVMGSNALFPFYQNFALDPNNYETFYLPTITSIWRKDNLKASSYDTSLRNSGWSHLSNVNVGDASEISFITVSKSPANRVFYGTSLGKVYRLDNANTGNPTPVDITGNEFPFNAFVACIDINPENADHLMVTFSNYGIQSLFHSSDGGSTWTAVGGNLEEFPDGTGNGPSIRCTKLLSYQDKKIIFAGTTLGLYSTTSLEGENTVWTQEGPESIGTVIVDMIDARSSDGFTAIATHGNGIYSTYYNSSAGIDKELVINSFQVGNIFPNPVSNEAELELVSEKTTILRTTVYSGTGELLKSFPDKILQPGKQYLSFQFGELPPGVYYLSFNCGPEMIVRKVLKVTSN